MHNIIFMEFDQAEFSFEILHERRAVLDPIAAIGVDDTEFLVDRRAMKMTADDAGRPVLAGLCRQPLLEPVPLRDHSVDA